MSARRVVITGTGAVTSLGVGADRLVDRWSAAESGIDEGVSACRDFEPAELLSKKEMRRTDRFTQLAIAASDEALKQAGWNGERPYADERVACVIGTGVGGMATHEKNHRAACDRGASAMSPLYVPMMMANSASGYVSLRYACRGPSFAVSSACASGAHAIGIAYQMIQAGIADAALAGASEAALTLLGIGGFAAMEALSASGTSLPFDARRDGFVIGEGAGMLLLEQRDAAEERGAEILGELLGYGTTTDAHHITAPDPEARGAVRAIELALEDAGLGPEDVDYVNAHGTATELNDRMETAALKRALGDGVHDVPVSSTKSVIGHLLGAAGAAEAVATVHALRRGVVPPTVGYEVQEEGLDLDYVPDTGRRLERRPGANGRPPVAISNSFGFGGHNVVLCLAGAS